jgi:hypothetical protein
MTKKIALLSRLTKKKLMLIRPHTCETKPTIICTKIKPKHWVIKHLSTYYLSYRFKLEIIVFSNIISFYLAKVLHIFLFILFVVNIGFVFFPVKTSAGASRSPNSF